jgi:hypothetical protein
MIMHFLVAAKKATSLGNYVSSGSKGTAPELEL